MTEFDGRQQRRALTAAEQAIKTLAGGDTAKAMTAAARATELDQIGAYAGFPEAVAAAARGEGWDALFDVVGPGPLQALVAELRTDARGDGSP